MNALGDLPQEVLVQPIYIGGSGCRIAVSEDMQSAAAALSSIARSTTLACETDVSGRVEELVCLLLSLSNAIDQNLPIGPDASELLIRSNIHLQRVLHLGPRKRALDAIAADAFKIVASVRPSDVVDVTYGVLLSLAMSARRWSDDRSRPAVANAVSAVLNFISCLDVPDSYYLVREYLHHPWVEIRSSAAWHLRRWIGPGLSCSLVWGLLQGEGDPQAADNSYFVMWRLGRLRDTSVLPVLQSLLGTSFDAENTRSTGARTNMLRAAISMLEDS
jgi:hypothetical protein